MKCDVVVAMHFRSAASRSLPREGRRMQMHVLIAYSRLASSVAYSRRIGHYNLPGGGYGFLVDFDDAQLCVKEGDDWLTLSPNPS